MADSVTPLHMVQLRFSLHDLHRAANEHKLPRPTSGGSGYTGDFGYLVHGQLQALFGDLAPQPFRLRVLRDTADVLAYGSADEAALRDHMATFAEPRYCQPEELSSKAMPTTWAAGRRLGFEVRVCPVVRLNSSGIKKRGSEVDAYQAAAEPYGPGAELPFRREDVYRDWLVRHLDGVAELESFVVERFRLRRLYRQTQGKPRKGALLQRPDAELHGELTVTDGEAFARLLARGIGRHRAFGFGMLLLRPPGRS